MPLVHSETIAGTCTVLIWQLSESEESLGDMLGPAFISHELSQISHPQKRREWLASRLLVKMLTEQFSIAYVGLHKDMHGKAWLIDNDSHISITHTFEYVAVALNAAGDVGIDMEKCDEKLLRTARKFLSPPEYDHADNDIQLLCMYWCAKEALYKMYGKKKISFREAIFINPFALQDISLNGKLRDDDIEINSRLLVRWIDGHCLAFAFGH